MLKPSKGSKNLGSSSVPNKNLSQKFPLAVGVPGR